MPVFEKRPRLFYHLLLGIGAITTIYPLLWMVSSSFKPQTLIFAQPGLIPSQFTFENYINGWTALGVPFTRFFANSFTIVTLVVIGEVFSASITGYAFARLEFAFKRVWFVCMLATIMLPFHVTLIPQYVMFNNLGWINTYLPLVVPHFFATTGFFVFLHVQFIRGIPRDLDDAAAVDGANKWQIYRHIILPLSQPAIITTAVFAFIWNWDNFFGHLLYISDVRLYTVTLALRSFMDSSTESSIGQMLALSVASLIPFFIIFVSAQRYLVQGISTTGFKG